MDQSTIFKSVLASRLFPLLTWSATVAVLFFHTGTFRIKPKLVKAKAAQAQPAAAQVTPSPIIAEPPTGSASVFLSLLEKAGQAPPRTSVKQSQADQPQPAQSVQMTFVSVRANDENSMPDGEGTGAMIPCRLERPISNAKNGSKILMHGVVIENITSSSGKILIEAGTRVIGIGRMDSLSGRIKSYGRWTLVTDNHELRAKARLLEYASGREGLCGRETSPEPPELQKQAIARDGLYLYVPAQEDFTLQLLGQFQLQDLHPAGPSPE
jgi:hypothetical protein